jgi:hypothetical protein
MLSTVSTLLWGAPHAVPIAMIAAIISTSGSTPLTLLGIPRLPDDVNIVDNTVDIRCVQTR